MLVIWDRPRTRHPGTWVTVAVAAAAVLACPAVADAATVEVLPQSFHYRAVVEFAAAPGEANDVDVAWEPDAGSPTSLLVTDLGAVLTAGNGCAAVDSHTARCSPSLSGSVNMIHADIRLGDGDDHVRFAPGSAGWGTAYLYGGPGNDVLDARNAFIARLDGGGGRDALYGSTEYSLMLDGDRDGGSGDTRPGPDLFVGQSSDDTVSYRQRSAPVRVDLADPAGDGEPGEGDRLRGIENVDGGRGDDFLAGNRHANKLNGGPGRDVLVGRGGDDQFAGRGEGAWTEIPPPRDVPTSHSLTSARGDVVRCGRGSDSVAGRSSRDFTPISCDAVLVHRPLPAAIGGAKAYTGLDPYPVRVNGRLQYSFACSFEDDWEWPQWQALRCHGRVELRTARRPHRLLARGRLRSERPHRWTGLMRAPLSFTRLGRARLAHRAGVRARVRFIGRHVPVNGWTIRLTRRGRARPG